MNYARGWALQTGVPVALLTWPRFPRRVFLEDQGYLLVQPRSSCPEGLIETKRGGDPFVIPSVSAQDSRGFSEHRGHRLWAQTVTKGAVDDGYAQSTPPALSLPGIPPREPLTRRQLQAPGR